MELSRSRHLVLEISSSVFWGGFSTSYTNFTYFTISFVLSPGDMSARMGLQESSEQIPGQCIQEGKGRMNVAVDQLVGWSVSC